MKFCPVVPEICRGQVHGARKERRITRTRRIIIIIIRNGAKTIRLQTLFGRLKNTRKHNKQHLQWLKNEIFLKYMYIDTICHKNLGSLIS